MVAFETPEDVLKGYFAHTILPYVWEFEGCLRERERDEEVLRSVRKVGIEEVVKEVESTLKYTYLDQELSFRKSLGKENSPFYRFVSEDGSGRESRIFPFIATPSEFYNDNVKGANFSMVDIIKEVVGERGLAGIDRSVEGFREYIDNLFYEVSLNGEKLNRKDIGGAISLIQKFEVVAGTRFISFQDYHKMLYPNSRLYEK